MRAKRLLRRIGQGLVLVVITAALFLLVEGMSSLVLAIKDAPSVPWWSARKYYYGVPAEERHARYDEELGWVSIPNLHLPRLYGEGRYLRTDPRGFRSDHPVEDRVPEGKIRIVCSGDSFTFGQGVANAETWCHLLSVANDRLETVNMGQRGYGLDQIYLWYMRDGRPLDHDLHVVAVIGADLGRMKNRRHKGYGKPVLRLRRGELEVTNVPVPAARRGGPSLLERVGGFARGLRTVQLGQRALVKTQPVVESGTREIALEVFETLGRVNREKGSVLVVVYLPVKWELEGKDSRWRLWLGSVAGEAGFPFVDLTPEMRAVDSQTAETFFIPTDTDEHGDAGGHYTERAHAWVAEVLYRRLLELPEVRAVLAP